mmetsp:Transcript_14796/g.55989  ORF Transcript_14796/g.55989 Transcript_14796/m.55989 type:complete len:226 (-) Transcript_14796:32-709(-)
MSLLPPGAKPRLSYTSLYMQSGTTFSTASLPATTSTGSSMLGLSTGRSCPLSMYSIFASRFFGAAVAAALSVWDFAGAPNGGSPAGNGGVLPCSSLLSGTGGACPVSKKSKKSSKSTESTWSGTRAFKSGSIHGAESTSMAFRMPSLVRTGRPSGPEVQNFENCSSTVTSRGLELYARIISTFRSLGRDEAPAPMEFQLHRTLLMLPRLSRASLHAIPVGTTCRT